jgi:hypothetical protein
MPAPIISAMTPPSTPEVVLASPVGSELDGLIPKGGYSIFRHGEKTDEPVVRAVTGTVIVQSGGNA